MPLEPESDLLLPFRMEMSIDFIDQNDTATFDDRPPLRCPFGQPFQSVCPDEMAHDVGKQRRCRTVAIAHLTPSLLCSITILEPESIRIHTINRDPIGHQIVTQQIQHQRQLLPFSGLVLKLLVLQIPQPLINLGQ